MGAFPSANLILGKNRGFSLSLPYSSQQSNCQGTARAGCSPQNWETGTAGQPTGQGPCQPKPAPKQGSRVGSGTSPGHQQSQDDNTSLRSNQEVSPHIRTRPGGSTHSQAQPSDSRVHRVSPRPGHRPPGQGSAL